MRFTRAQWNQALRKRGLNPDDVPGPAEGFADDELDGQQLQRQQQNQQQRCVDETVAAVRDDVSDRVEDVSTISSFAGRDSGADATAVVPEPKVYATSEYRQSAEGCSERMVAAVSLAEGYRHILSSLTRETRAVEWIAVMQTVLLVGTRRLARSGDDRGDDDETATDAVVSSARSLSRFIEESVERMCDEDHLCAHSLTAPSVASAALHKALSVHVTGGDLHIVDHLDGVARCVLSRSGEGVGGRDNERDLALGETLNAYSVAFLASVAHVVAMRLTHYSLSSCATSARKSAAAAKGGMHPPPIEQLARLVFAKSVVTEELCSVVRPRRGAFVVLCVAAAAAHVRSALSRTFRSEVEGVSGVESALDVLFDAYEDSC